MNQLQSMNVFVEVVEKNGFARAAQSLNISTAAVSAHVNALEKHLDTVLLNRTTRHVALTSEGADYYTLCKHVLEQIAEGESSITNSTTNPSGRVRVDALDNFIHALVLPILPEFFARYPDIRLDFVQSGHLFDASQIGVDVMIRLIITNIRDPAVIVRPLGETKLACAASPAYLDMYGTPATPYDLSLHTCIQYIEHIGGRRWWWQFYSADGEPIVPELRQTIAFSGRQLRIEAAIRGFGITYESLCDIAEPLRKGQLRLILEDWMQPAPPIYVAYPKSRENSGKVQAFINFLLEKYPPGQDISPPPVNLKKVP